MKVNLSKRLRCIADYIDSGSRVADVGTDHGYIPAWLIQNGICERVIASDIKAGPLQTAVNTAKSAGVEENIDFRLCSGLDAYSAGEVDQVIMAGMGGETLISILEAKPWTREKKLIMQPQSKIPELRSWLRENGYVILDAQLVYDAGRIYLVWLVTGGRETDSDGLTFNILLKKRDPLLGAYLEDMIKRTLKRLKGLEKATVESSAELFACRKELEELQKMKEEVSAW